MISISLDIGCLTMDSMPNVLWKTHLRCFPKVYKEQENCIIKVIIVDK